MALSPMMEKYLETKKEYPDCILLYRLGDFYELFFEDAELASKELGLTLTGKDCGLEERAPMCGVPFHAVDTYLTKLVENGHKVAIAEQMEDPRFAKGLVKREVIRVVTPGTLTDMNAIEEGKNRYILSVIYDKGRFGIACSDVTTGEFYVFEADTKEDLVNEFFRFSPTEVLCNDYFELSGFDVKTVRERLNFSYTVLDRSRFQEEAAEQTLCRHFSVGSAESLGLKDLKSGMAAAGALLSYLYDTQKNELKHISKLTILQGNEYMLLDSATRRNLELTETLREKEKRGTLLWVLDKTKTAMGARMLRKFVEQPLLSRKEIQKRQEGVRELVDDPILREEIREYLNPVYDLERLLCKISYKTANPKDLIAFRNSIRMVPHIKRLLMDAKSAVLKQIYEELDELEDLYTLIFDAIEEDPPVLVHEGNIIKDGYHELVDEYRRSKTEGKSWLMEVEATEREKTGIKTLKVKYNKVFGYYIEVTNSFLSMVPDYFVRKQTLTGGERFITPRLKELEDIILGAEDKLNALEFELFRTVRDTVDGEAGRVETTANALALLDALASLAHTAEKNHYVCPKLNERGRITIKNGRHPVIELTAGQENFVPNDT
ncbi:MAG: DNA mismatch repair protein MutS, partial [Lachnospiraceae bacterium]|nr:DNA mismatch repair protein MutS [Lachnospiraceae bacterium]